MLLSLLVLTSFWAPFRSEFDPRELNLNYVLLERARIQGDLDITTTIKPISSTESALINEHEPDVYLRFRVRDWGFFARTTENNMVPSNEFENYLHLYGEASWRYKGFEVYHSTGLFNEQKYHTKILKYYDPLINPDFRLYTFDLQPPIGHVHLFDLRTDYAFIHYHSMFWDFSAGRFPVRLGPGFRSSLFLSGYALPLNYVYNIRLHKKGIDFLAAYALFPDTIKWKRFSYQRLVMRLGRHVEIGFNQGVIWADSDPFKYINPVDLYYIVQRRGESNEDNLIGGGDVSVFVGRRAKLYMEFFDDDFIVTSNLPSKYGLMLGAHVVDPMGIGMSDLIVEFTHINPWTYPHFYSNYAANPEVLGYPIGFWGGPGCNDFTVDFFKFAQMEPTRISGFRAGYEYLQHTQLDMRSGSSTTIPYQPDFHYDVRHSFHFFVFRKSTKIDLEGGLEITFLHGRYMKGQRIALRFNVSYLPVTVDLSKFVK